MTQSYKIAFVSCARHQIFPNQPQWKEIEDQNPDYLFLLGDNIYMDFGIFGPEKNGTPKSYSPEKFEEVMRSKYEKQWDEPHFRSLFKKMQAKNAVYGTWDDHDFAWNNSQGMDPENMPEWNIDAKKVISRELFNEFIYDEKVDKPIQCSFEIGNLAKVIFLDGRFYSQKGSHMLGQEQFEFLESELDDSIPYNIICSGLSLTHGSECWKKFPAEYQKFKELVKEKKVLYLGGDLHKNIFKRPNQNRPCYEIISSGLAITVTGLLGKLDRKHNWGILELTPDKAVVTLKQITKKRVFEIDQESWQYKQTH